MKLKSIHILLASSLLFGVSAWADADDKKPDTQTKPATEAKEGDKKEAEKEPVVKHDEAGSIVVHLEDETQKRGGIASSEVVATNLAAEVKSYGRVVDPTALSGLVSDLALAQAAGMASSNELARLKKLASSGNASDRAVQAAEAASLHDTLMTQAAKDRMVLSFGREIAGRTDLAELSRSLGSTEAALIRAELPAGEALESAVKTARIITLLGKATAAEGLGLSLSVDAQSQGRAYLLLVRTNDLKLLPGESVTAYLQSGGDVVQGFFIPSAAVVRTDGKPWIYVVKDEDHFFRREIKTDVPMEEGWFVKDTVKAGEKLVTLGAQAAYSEEVKASAGSGD